LIKYQGVTTMCNRLWRAIRKSLHAAAVIVLAATGAAAGSGVRAADTVKIGFRPLTGPLASNGEAILTAYQMWQEDINAKGDLPVARAEEFRYPAEELQNAARSNAVEAAS
jgi:ABC-type branched-subunit amino acid transport system substrate-binding protein